MHLLKFWALEQGIVGRDIVTTAVVEPLWTMRSAQMTLDGMSWWLAQTQKGKMPTPTPVGSYKATFVRICKLMCPGLSSAQPMAPTNIRKDIASLIYDRLA